MSQEASFNYHDANHSSEEREAIEALSDAAVESLSDDIKGENLEAFEAYTHALRNHIKDHLPNFRERFAQGYSTVLAELQHPSSNEQT